MRPSIGKSGMIVIGGIFCPLEQEQDGVSGLMPFSNMAEANSSQFLVMQ
jgi:hypothetical protein